MHTRLPPVAATLAGIAWLAMAAPAPAAECLRLGVTPLVTTPVDGVTPSGANSRDDCFSFSTDGGNWAITGMNSVDLRWVGNPPAVDMRNLAVVDDLTLHDADGLVIAPVHVQAHVGTFVTPRDAVPSLAGHTWTYRALAPGVDPLNSQIGWNDGDGSGVNTDTLAITAVPEAASAVMFSLGMALLTFTPRRPCRHSRRGPGPWTWAAMLKSGSPLAASGSVSHGSLA
jgi:hypothetical protein